MLWEQLETAAVRHADSVFFTDLRGLHETSYAGLFETSRDWCAALAAHDIGPGDRVAYVTENRFTFFALLYACAARGAALVPISDRSLAREQRTIIADCGASLVLYDADRVAEPDATWVAAEPPPLVETAEVLETDADDEALIIYTSGTTGNSKGVMLTQRNLRSMGQTFARFYAFRPQQRFLCMLPFFHINAPMITGLSCIEAGASVFVTEPYGFTNAKRIFSFVAAHQIHVVSFTPSIMASLLKLHPDGPPSDVSSVEFAMVGTAHLPEDLWRRFEERFGFPCYQGYGLTETTTWATMTPPTDAKRYDTAGIPVDCDVRIADDEGEDNENGGDEDGRDKRGEVLIRGNIVMKGYNGQPKVTRKLLRDGWFRTGDIGVFEADGQLRIVGRLKNIIKRRGILIYPEDIDRCLREHPDVNDACTVGLVDEESGERVVSAVVGAASTPQLQAHLQESLSRSKHPDRLVALQRIPLSPMGKPDLTTLRAILSGERAASIVESFSSYRFTRASDASMHERIVQTVQNALLADQPVRFAGFWGVGRRSQINDADLAALDRLVAIVEVVNTARQASTTEFEILLADVHGRCNEVPPASADAYLAAIRDAIEARGFTAQLLSRVWAKHGLELEPILKTPADPEVLEAWSAHPLRETLLRQAAKRVSESSAPVHALRYFRVCRHENPALARELEGRIFFTYNAPTYQSMLPDLPTAYWHSTKRGTARKPWFEDEAGPQAT